MFPIPVLVCETLATGKQKIQYWYMKENTAYYYKIKNGLNFSFSKISECNFMTINIFFSVLVPRNVCYSRLYEILTR